MFKVNAISTNIAEDWYHKNNILYWSGDFVYLEIAGEIKHICWQNKKGILFIFLSFVKVTQNVAAADLRFSGSGSDFSQAPVFSPPIPGPSPIHRPVSHHAPCLCQSPPLLNES